MVAIVSGNSLGVSLTSMNTLGQRGAQGVATQGRNGEQAYVNAFSGNLVLQDRDDMLVNHGIDIAALRTYNSQGKFTDDNGDNWSNGVYSQQLRISGSLSAAGSSIVRTGCDGSESTYLYDNTRQLYISTDGGGAYNTISVNAGTGQLIWSNGSSGLKEAYDGSGSGRLLSSTDSNGNTITYSYGANGLLASVTDAAGEATYYDYNGTNLSQIRTVTADGHTLTRVRYSYDASNRLSTVTLDLTPADNAISDNQVYRTTYTYDGDSKRIASVTQSDGSSQSFTYVQVGADYRIATVQDGLNHVTSYSYDTASGRTTVIDPLGLKTLYDYDSKGQLTRITTPAVAGVAASTSFSYNATGDVTQVVDGEGHAIDMQYDGNGNQILQRDAAGNTVTRTYDANNQLQTETTYVIADPDGAGPGQPGTPLTTRYIYDSGNHNQLRFVVSPQWRVTEYRYNSFGERSSSLQYLGGVYGTFGMAVSDVPSEATMVAWAVSQDQSQMSRTDMIYDARGQLQSSSSWSALDATGNGIANGSQTVIQYLYDQSGQLINTIGGRGGVTHYTYDGLGRVLTSKDAADQLTISSYDDANHKTTVTQANGLAIISTYDQAGRLVSVQQSNAGQALGTTQYAYDADNRLRMTQDPTGVRNFILYDEAGRKAADIDGNGSVTEYAYNKDNQLTQTIAYANKVDVNQLADALENLTAATLASIRPGASALDHKSWRAYDSANRLSKTVDGQPGLVTEYFYDGASRLVGTTSYANLIDTANLGSSPGAASITPVVSAADRSNRSAYDDDGLVRVTLDAEGYLTKLHHDNAGRLDGRAGYALPVDASLRASDALVPMQPVGTSSSDYVMRQILDGKGQVVGEVDGELYLTEKVYDGNGNITQTIRYATKLAAAISLRATVASIRPASSANDRVTTADYDALNRIKQQTNAEGTVTQYIYDNAGHLTQTISAAGTSDVRAISARYDVQGRLTGELTAEGSALLTGGQTQAQIDAIWSSYGLTHTYDAAGRRTSTTDQNGNKTLFFYDVDNRLTQTINALGEVSEKQYNGLGQLAATVQYGTRISTSGLTGGLVSAALTSALNAVRNSSLDSVNSFTYNANGTLATSTDALKNVTTYSYDSFGDLVSSTRVIDATHALTQTSSYDRRGLVVATGTDALGVNATTTMQYDGFGRVIRSVDANGNVRSQSYDRAGRMVQSVDPLNALRSSTYDAFDRVLTQTDGLGNVTLYSYNTTARSTTLTTPEGVAVTTVRTRNGQTQSVTDGLGNVTQYSYDKNGNLLSTAGSLSSTSGSYDHANRLMQSRDANGNLISYSYDAANRLLTRQVDPNGLNLTTRYQYDAKGQQVVTTDANGVATQISFNLKGQALSQTLDPTGLKLTTQYSYDGSGNVLTVTSPGGTITQYVYDNLGRRIEQHVDPSGLNLTTNTSYDKKGNAVTVTDPNRNVTRYVYDANDRLAFTIDAQGNVTQTTYDVNGRVLQTTKYATPISLDGLSAAPVPADIQSRLVSNAADATELRRYDRDGRLTWVIDATGAVTQNSYDANGNVIKRLAYATRLGANDLAALKANVATAPAPVIDAAHDRVTQIAYDALGRAIYIVDANGAVVEQHYDGNGNSIERITYTKTIPVGQLATLANIAQQLKAIADPAHDGHVVYVYDSAERLIYTVNAAGAVSKIDYDNNNVVRRTDYATPLATPVTVTTNPAAVVASSADRAANYVYDAANRQIYSVDAIGAVTQQIYDVNGQITQTIKYAKPIALPSSVSGSNFLTTVQVQQQLLTNQSSGLRSGTGTGVNQLLNAGFSTIGSDGVPSGWTYGDWRVSADQKGADLNAAWSVNQSVFGEKTYYLHQAGRDGTNSYQEISQFVNVDAGKNYSFSAYVGAHRATTEVIIQWYGADGNPIGVAPVTADSQDANQQNTGGPTLDGYKRVYAAGNAPPGAVRARLILRKDNTDVGQADSWLFATRAQFEEIAATATSPSDWKPTILLSADDHVTSNVYDAAGRLQQQTKAAGTAAVGTISYGYDAMGNAVSITNERGYTTTQQFDTLGRKTSTSVPLNNGVDDKGPLQYAVTTTQYDAFGNAVKITDPMGNAGYFYYDQDNRVVLQVDPLGYATQTSYTATGKPNLVVRYATPVSGPLSTSTPPALTANAADAPTKLEYDQNDRLVKNTDAEGNIELYGYDSFGDRISYQNKVGGVTTSVYDSRGLLLSETLPITSRNSAGAPAPVVKQYSYDALGNRIQMIEAAGLPEQRTTNYGYDQNGRVISQSGDVVTIRNASGWSTGSPTQHWTYDAVGNKTSYIDANGNQTHWYYDAANRKVAELSAAGTLSAWTYDAACNMVSMRIYGDTVALPAGGTLPTAVNPANYRETDYSYDKANRQVQTLVDGATIAQRPIGGTDVNISFGQIKTFQQYDALGNVISQTDGKGNQTLFYYNAVGKKIAQVDAENYLTVWVRDQNDSVTMEYRYANRLSAVATTASVVSQLMQNAGSNSSDRITTSSYDHLNRLLTQSRLNLVSSSLNGSGGLVTATGAATTRYVYDGLGNVIEKTEANGDVSDWNFDAMGRQTRTQGASFVDFQGTLVRPITDTVYDGLGDVTQSIVRGKNSADDRVTTFRYDAAGHLSGKSTLNIDGSYEYYSDAVGNITEARINSKNSDCGKRWDATVITYDEANREVSRQVISAVNGDPSKNVWISGDIHGVRYDAYGEVVGKGVNGSTAEFAEYDSLGRLWKTNAGDGATKAYLYDSNGNATVLLQSAGADMRTMTLAQILAISQAQGTSPDPVVQAAIAAGGIHMTVSIYDRNNQLTDTYQPTMQSAHNMGTIQQFLTQQAGGSFTGGSVTVGPTKASTSLGTTAPAYQGSVAINSTLPVGFSFSATRTTYNSGPGGTLKTIHDTRQAWVSLPAGSNLGGGNFHLYFNGTDYAQAAWNATSISYSEVGRSWPPGTNTVAVYQDVPGGGQRLIAQASIVVPVFAQSPVGEPTDVSASATGYTTPLVQFQNQSPSTDRLLVLIRPAGSNSGWIPGYATPLTNSAGGAMPGWFSQSWSGTGENGTFDMQYIALDASGNVLNVERGTMVLSASNPSITQSAQPIGGAGQAAFIKDVWYSAAGALNFMQQSTAAQSLRVHYRHAGSAEAWGVQVLGPAGIGSNPTATPGWFALRTDGFSGAYEYFIETFTGANATGTMLNRASGTFTPNGDASALTSWTDLPENVVFNNQPANSAQMRLTYTLQGGAPASIVLPWDAVHQQFNWDASALVADRLNNYRVDYQYQTVDASGAIVNAGHGALQIGKDPGELVAHQNDQQPATITFTPPPSNASQLVLQYRNAGSTGIYNTVALTKDATGKFTWNVDALRPGAGTVSLEYAYDLYDANGQLVPPSGGNPRAQGVLNINSDKSSTTRQLQWTITGLNNTAPDVPNTQAAIHRTQAHDAFGDVTSEVDGLRHSVTLAYDTMGQLISKQAPETNVTLENGTIVRATPTTQYYYDASSHLVGVRDANGNLNTQSQLAGFGNASASNTRTTTEFHADGGVKHSAYDIFGDLRTTTDELGHVTSNTYDQAGRLIQVVHAARQPGTASNPGATAVSAVDSYTYDTQGNRISHTNALQQRETTDYDPDGRVIRTRSFAGQEITYTYSYDQSILGVGGVPVGGWVKTTSYTGSRSSSDKTDYFQHTTSHQDFGGHVVTYNYDYAAHLKSQTSTAGQSVDYSYYANGYLKSTTDHALNVLSYFEYDEEGNRTRESYTSADAPASRIIYQLADIKYDELNRVIDYVDPQARIQYQYDANGNRRRVLSNYNDGINGAAATQDFWYKYDGQNRFVLTMGQLSNGVIGLGSTGVQIGYDVAGQRRSAVYADGHSETYNYTNDGYLEDVQINGVLRSRRANDLLGRVQSYLEYATDGSTVIYNKGSVFDADNRLTQDSVVQSPVGGTASTTVTNYDYRLKDGNGNYTGADQGVVTHSYQYDSSKAAGTGVHTDTSFVWWDEAKQSQITLRGTDPSNPNAVYWKPGLSDFTYDVNGHLKQVNAYNDGTLANTRQNLKTLKYTSDQYGQVLRRDTLTGTTQRLGLAQRYYYLNGQLIGDVSNNGPTNISYAEQLAQRGTPQYGMFRYGRPVASADFDQNYQPINADYPGAAASSYTAKDGDTLSSIARAVWGDSTLWYLIADANGLTNGDHLVAGQVISIPNKVSNFHNTASTFRVYNPGQAIGDTLPTLPTEPLPPPPPSSDGGCGGFGQILALVVAIVVIYLTNGAATEAMGPILGGAATGAAAATASQAVLIATGDQKGFNWNGVAIGAIGGAVAGGIMQYGPALQGSSAFTQGAVRGAMTSVVTQGVGVATGLQSHFDWRGVAASAITSGVSAGVADSIGRYQYGDAGWDALNSQPPAVRSGMLMNDLGQTMTRGIASGLAAGVAGGLVRGGSLKSNLPGILQDIANSTIGNMIAERTAAGSMRSSGNGDQPADGSGGNLLSSIAQLNDDSIKPRINFSDDGYKQARPLAERLGLTSSSTAPQMSFPSSSGDAGGDGAFTTYRDYIGQTSEGVAIATEEATYHRSVSATTNASALGITDAQVDAAIARGETGTWDAVSYAGRKTGYAAWNFATAGFVERHDARIQANADGRLSDANFWKATAIDGGASVGSMFVAGRVGGFVAGRVGNGYFGSMITGAAAGGAFDLTLQGGQNAAYFATNGQTGSLGFSGSEFAAATAFGGVLGVGGKYLSEYGNYNIELKSFEPGILYSNPLSFKLVPPENFKFGAYLRDLIGPAPEDMVDPHAHHILFKEGNGVDQKALVQEGQALLRRFDIDPVYGVENLTWAPNRIAGQHGIDALRNVTDSLNQVEQFGGTRADIVKKLQELGQLAAQRK